MSNTTRQALDTTHRCAPPLRHGLLVVAGCGLGYRYRHDEAAVARVGGEDAVVAQQMASRARHQRRQAREEVERFDEIAGSDFEPPKAGPKGGGQDARSSRNSVVPS